MISNPICPVTEEYMNPPLPSVGVLLKAIWGRSADEIANDAIIRGPNGNHERAGSLVSGVHDNGWKCPVTCRRDDRARGRGVRFVSFFLFFCIRGGIVELSSAGNTNGGRVWINVSGRAHWGHLRPDYPNRPFSTFTNPIDSVANDAAAHLFHLIVN